ncbi:MAG: hypothetical protein P8I26_01980 [Flavobacteriaceae bacterium]|nr:hypothetical protein [Flavobacteriaceae bacterium]
MKGKIIFIKESILSKRDYERYKFNDFIQSGYGISVLDLTSFNNHDYKEDVDIYSIAKEIVFSPSSKKEILEYIKGIDHNSIIISLSRVNKKTFFIYKKILKKGNKIGFLFLGSTPDVYFNLNKKTLRSLLRKIKNIIIQRLYGIHSHFYIVGSKVDVLKSENHVLFSKKSRFIYHNNLDYDLYLNNEKLNNKNTSETKYAVFLDEYCLHHPDNNIAGISPVGKNYYSELNSFFSKIESKYSVKVIIAAHPRSRYDKIGNPFQGRKILKMKTIDLVKYSEFVLAHASTAITMSVIYKKPIVSLTSRYYHHTYINSIELFSETLSSTLIDLSNENYRLPNSFEINNKAYEDYHENYINYKNSNNLTLVNLIQDYQSICF